MPIEIRLSKLSDTMESATLVRWLKQVSDKVVAGEIIAEIETDKATVEIEAPISGILDRILIQEGTENVPVGELLALIESTEVRSRPPERSSSASKVDQTPMGVEMSRSVRESHQSLKETVDSVRDDPSAQTTTIAMTHQTDMTQVTLHSTGATPLAKAMARIAGIDLASVDEASASIVTRAQVEQALGLPMRSREVAHTSVDMRSAETEGAQLVRHNVIRKVIAARMTESKQKIPHFYLTNECDVSVATEFLERLNREQVTARLTLTSLAIKAAASAIRQVPAVNSDWKPNHLVMRETNIAVAVAAPSGLVAPVIKRPDQKTLLEIAAELEKLVLRARNELLTLQDTSGGTFTISNLGMFGVDNVFPIITPGQSGVLGIGASRNCPVIRDGAVVAAKLMAVTFSGDHRAIDGAQGAEFLREFKKYIEEPVRMIL